MRATDKILIVMIVYLVLFSAGVLVIFWHTGEEPTVLVGGTVAALVTEIIALCRIRINKENLRQYFPKNEWREYNRWNDQL